MVSKHLSATVSSGMTQDLKVWVVSSNVAHRCCWAVPSMSKKHNYEFYHSKILSDLYTGVNLKDAKKFGSKVIDRQFFHRKTVFHMKILSIINFTTKLLSIKDYFLNGPQ